MTKRLLILAEGQTEEMFAREVLGPYFLNDPHERHRRVNARTLMKEMGYPDGGGIVEWDEVRRLIVRKLDSERDCTVTTMVDYYKLPRSWIDKSPYADKSTTVKAEAIRSKLEQDIRENLPDPRYHGRFVPYVSMHEFEGLLFSDCQLLAKGIQRPDLADDFEKIRMKYRGGTPEDINDNYDTTPARRIRSLVPEYEKPLYGALAALEITVETMRRECPEFDRWVGALKDRLVV